MSKRAELNSADWGRIEAALRAVVDEFAALPESERHPRALPAMQRTLDKVNRINNQKDAPPQSDPTLNRKMEKP